MADQKKISLPQERIADEIKETIARLNGLVRDAAAMNIQVSHQARATDIGSVRSSWLTGVTIMLRGSLVGKQDIRL